MATLANSRHKIQRAEKHIADFQSRVVALIDSDAVSIEVNPETRQEFIKHDPRDKTAAVDIGLIIGDAIHNLKCALDFAWLDSLERLSLPTEPYSKLPVFPSKEQLERVLFGGKVHAANPRLCPFLINEIKPYEGGNGAIWFIHKLDIDDKHRLLIQVTHYLSINGIELENQAGNIESGNSRGTWQSPPWHIHIPDGFKVKNHGKLGLKMLFDQATPTHHLDIEAMLLWFKHETVRVTESLEAFLKREGVTS